MKNLIKISVLLAALALVFAGCNNTLSQTDPDFGTVRESFGANGANVVTGAAAYPSAISGALDADTGTSRRDQASIEFPDIDLDALREAKTLEELEGKIKGFLHFYILKKETNASNITNAKVEAGSRTEITDWKVIRRDGRTVYIQFPNVSNSYSFVIETKIDSAKYTYGGGILVDYDNNGVPGESFYDDFYDYSITVAIDGSDATVAASATDYVAIDNSPVAVNITYVPTGTGADGSTALGFSLAAQTSAPVEFQLSVADPNTATSYADMVGKLLSIEQPGEDGQWKTSNITPALTRFGTTANYYARVTFNHRAIYRLVINGIKDTTLQNEVNGGKRRLAFQYASSAVNLKNNKLYSSVIEVENPSAALSEYTSNFWNGSPTIGSDSEGRNVTVTLTLNTTLTNTPSGAPVGINLTDALLNTEFRLGLVGASTPAGGVSLPQTPQGSTNGLIFNPGSPGTWADNITFVNIVKADLKYADNYAGANTVPDTLVLYLDPEFRRGGNNNAYLFISNKVSFGGGAYEFGNWRNYTSTYKGLRAYGAIGSGW
jgi:hypothetical protein